MWSLQERESVSSVDVGLNKIQGSLSCGYGIVFDVKACSGVSGDDVAGGDGCDSGDDVANGVSTADSMLVLMIRVSGEYLVGKVSDGIFTSICPWTKDENLKTGSGNENKIKLYKSEGEYFVSFNGDEVSTSFFDPRQIDNASQEDSENAIENFGYVVVIAPNENFPKSNVKVIFSREGE